jgi:hypothetical protein
MEEEQVIITCICPHCGATTDITVSRRAYQNWIGGKCIQHCMSNMSNTQRETLMSGFCAKCQIIIFREDEEEEEDN